MKLNLFMHRMASQPKIKGDRTLAQISLGRDDLVHGLYDIAGTGHLNRAVLTASSSLSV